MSELGYGSLAELVSVNKKFEAEGNPLTPAYRYHKRLHEEQQQMLIETGLKSLYPDMKQFYLEQQQVHGTANKRMIEAIRSNPHMDGYCVHALTGGDWILGTGLLDLWRNLNPMPMKRPKRPTKLGLFPSEPTQKCMPKKEPP